MPWSGESFAKHNHGLSSAQDAHAARIANAVLKRSGDEGMSIAVANRYFQRHDDGGGIVDPASGQYGGIAPSPETMNPVMRGMIQRYSSMAPEKLQELSVMMGGSPQGQIIQRLLRQKQMMPQVQQRGGMVHREIGGQMSMSQAMPGWSRTQQSQEDTGAGASGYLHGSTPGRADAILTTAPAGSHVVPADIIAGLGEGNSLAGAKVFDRIMRTGPGGIPMPSSRGGRGLPHAPAPFREAAGGVVGGDGEQTPVALSHGEAVVPPHVVRTWGGGDQKLGHKIWDDWIVTMRKFFIDQLKKLPPPVKSR